MIAIKHSWGLDGMEGVDEVRKLLFHLRRLEPLGHEIDWHDGSVHLEELAQLALDAVLEGPCRILSTQWAERCA